MNSFLPKLAYVLVLLTLLAAVTSCRRGNPIHNGTADRLTPQILLPGFASNRTTCYVFRVPFPRTLTDQTVNATLRQTLDPSELTQVVDPLSATPEMREWAQRLTGGATNDLGKAKLIYDALAHRLSFHTLSTRANRTAKEVFGAYQATNTSFMCLELAYFYIAAASAVHLHSCVALIEADCSGKRNPHACAAVDLGGKVLLVDPIYSWFGVPHKQFELLDRVQTIAAYLAERGSLEQCRIACKLAPSLLMARVGLFLTLIREQRWDEARLQAQQMRKMSPEAPEVLDATALLDMRAGTNEQAIQLLRKAVQEAPTTYQYHLHLGGAYMAVCRWPEAREAFQQALRFATTDDCAADARQALAYVGSRMLPTNEDIPILPMPTQKP